MREKAGFGRGLWGKNSQDIFAQKMSLHYMRGKTGFDNPLFAKPFSKSPFCTVFDMLHREIYVKVCLLLTAQKS